MDHDIDAEIQGLLVVGRRKSGIDDGLDPVSFGQGDDLFQVNDIHVRIGRRFGEDDRGLRPDGRLDGLGVRRDQFVFDLKLAKQFIRELPRLPITIVGKYDVRIFLH